MAQYVYIYLHNANERKIEMTSLQRLDNCDMFYAYTFWLFSRIKDSPSIPLKCPVVRNFVCDFRCVM